MEFRILGPLEVVEGTRRVSLGSARQRALLALLVLHANERLTFERLIGELWGESPPATASKILQVYVSRLRRGVGLRELLVTEPGGYALRVGRGQVDVHRFEALREEGTRALAAGDPGRAATKLREALGVWRGRALADLAYEPFAQQAILRLEELRLATLEEWLEAELALGRHAERVADLEGLVAEYPLRERMRRQLMLALYRSGRQAEALEVARTGIRMLRDDLGLEPSSELRDLERAILQQDAGLQARPRRHDGHARPKAGDSVAAGRTWWPLIATAAGAAAVIGLAVVLGTSSDRSTKIAEANSVAVIDPASDAIVAAVPVGIDPSALAVAPNGVWVANRDDRTVSRIDPDTNRVVKTIAVGFEPTALAAGANAVWVAGSLARVVIGIDLQFSAVTVRTRFATRVTDIAFGWGRVWVGTERGVSLLAPRTGRITGDVNLFRPVSGLAISDRTVWATVQQVVGSAGEQAPGFVIPIDGATRALGAPVPVGQDPNGVAVGAGAVWTIVTDDGALVRIDPVQRTATAKIRLGARPLAEGPCVAQPVDCGGGIAVGAGSVWIAGGRQPRVYRVDPGSGETASTIPVDGLPVDVTVGHNRIWVAVAGR